MSNSTDKNIPTRYPHKMKTDINKLYKLLDDEVIAQIAFIRDNKPEMIPSSYVRVGNKIIIHASSGSGWMRHILEQEKTSFAVFSNEAVVVARSTFESSLHYRSGVIYGKWYKVTGAEAHDFLINLSEKLIPGRTSEVRASSKKEYAATMVLALEINDWAYRESYEWPEDNASDIAGDSWAGVVYSKKVFTHYDAAPDLRSDIAVPNSVQHMLSD